MYKRMIIGTLCSFSAFIITLWFAQSPNYTITELNPVMDQFLSVSGYILILVYAVVWAVIWSLYFYLENKHLSNHLNYFTFLVLFVGILDLTHNIVSIIRGIL